VKHFLLFTVCAPMASWGDIAVGEVRGSWERPARSAMQGLLAAALGFEREDQAAHDALQQDYGIAVRVETTGEALTDYHTAQTVAASAARRAGARTRAELLAAVHPSDRQTILSRRTYRTEVLVSVALWARTPTPHWSLDTLADALRGPRFVLYAGRKSNPLALPLAPRVDRARTLADAMVAYGTSRGMRVDAPGAARDAVLAVFDRQWARRPSPSDGDEVAHDPCEDFESGLEPIRRETRRDSAPHRGRWQFAERTIDVGRIGSDASDDGTAQERSPS
jgi:CRISPR system Cascade subunit CasD